MPLNLGKRRRRIGDGGRETGGRTMAKRLAPKPFTHVHFYWVSAAGKKSQKRAKVVYGPLASSKQATGEAIRLVLNMKEGKEGRSLRPLFKERQDRY